MTYDTYSYVEPFLLLYIFAALILDQSFLGMNTIEFPTPFSPSNMTSPALAIPATTSPSSTYSSSATPISSQGSPNPQLWNMSAFGILSGPLLFATIILPVIVGPLTRWLLQTSTILLKLFRQPSIWFPFGMAIIFITIIIIPTKIDWKHG